MQSAELENRMSVRITGGNTFPCPFGDFEILSKLGKGGMGNVFKAMDNSFKGGRLVALKIMDSFNSNDDQIKRFEAEANAMKELDHQNIVQVYGYGFEGEQQFIAMKYVEGTNLSELLKVRGRLDFPLMVNYAQQICRGLRYAHSFKIIHRDVKPSNIIVTKSDRIYITDFGISYIKDMDRLTTTGMAMGTPEYMSPEQCQGNDLNVQTDIYSVGCILYELITGNPPFIGNKPLAIAYNHVNKEPEALDVKRRGVPDQLTHIVNRCLAKSKLDRYKNMVEVLDDLDNVEFGAVTQAKETIKGKYKKHRENYDIETGEQKRITDSIRAITGTQTLKGFAALLTLILGIIAYLLFAKADGLGVITPESVAAEYMQTFADGPLSPDHLLDKKIGSAWASNGVFSEHMNPIKIIFSENTLVYTVGIAVGYQLSRDDSYQDRFEFFAKPKVVVIKTDNNQMRRIVLKNIKGVQYFNIQPFEAHSMELQIREIYSTGQSTPVAISELKVLGVEL